MIKVTSKQLAEKSISDVASRARRIEKTIDVEVFVDGTWQRKGFLSTPEIVTAIFINSGKVLDLAILSKQWLKKYEKNRLFWSFLLWDMENLKTAGATKIFSLSKGSMDYITPLIMTMMRWRHILLSKIYMVQLNLLRSLNVLVTIKNVSVRDFVICEKHKRTGRKRKARQS